MPLHPLKMQPMKEIPKAEWDKILPTADKNFKDVMAEFKATTWAETKTYKEHVQVTSGSMPDCSFRIVKGEMTVKGPIEKAI